MGISELQLRAAWSRPVILDNVSSLWCLLELHLQQVVSLPVGC